MPELRLATRRSPLAMAQTRLVIEQLAGLGVEAVPVAVETTGDRDRVSPVTTLTEVGAFVRAVQRAVLEGAADAAVHSGKDLPVDGPDELVAAYPRRGSALDVMCGADPAGLRSGARVGTGSPRRQAQLRLLREDVEVVDIRGNVETRLRRVGDDLDAVVVAEAGLDRLGRQESISHRFPVTDMVPAPAQGALTVESRRESTAASILSEIDHLPTRRAVEAERRLLALTGAGCRAALGALAVEIAGGRIEMAGFVADERGPRRGTWVADDPEGAAVGLRRELGL